eukprot:2385034-Pyramimonas_sp.AAC.1
MKKSLRRGSGTRDCHTLGYPGAAICRRAITATSTERVCGPASATNLPKLPRLRRRRTRRRTA